MKFKRAENEQPRISFLLFSNAQCSLPVQGEGPRPCISPHLPSRIPLKYQNIKNKKQKQSSVRKPEKVSPVDKRNITAAV